MINNFEKTLEKGWNTLKDDIRKQEIFSFADEYMHFLNNAKTEREFIYFATKLLKENGFVDIEEKQSLNVGDKVFYNNKGKSMYIAKIGEALDENGFLVIGSHIDSPRLDLKPNPLYESDGFAYLKTHYYGGIKKYQWTAIPLAIHGVIVKTDGTKINVSIGEKDDEPIFTITDLLPHLAKDQMKKTLSEGISGEDLNILLGEIPSDDESKEKVKHNILQILNSKYDVTEQDLNSSELEIVPAFKARTTGLDLSMVASYGQDDRSCSYCALRSIIDASNIVTSICILSDKEEIGSMGNTGMESNIFNYFVSELLNKLGLNRPNLIDKVYVKSKMLSADVDAAFDPIYPSVSDKPNSAMLGHGVSINKYTGAGGKYNSSDASAEYVASIRNIFEKNNVQYQVTELGKIDVGGGGTIAYILANKGLEVIDCGIPILSMHSPYEVSSKFDLYEAYRAYTAFYNSTL